MGGNVAEDVASGNLCESTLALDNLQHANDIRSIFHTDRFRVNIISDVAGAELCGALKNVVALGAGFCDGLRLPQSTKAAIIRQGFSEMRELSHILYPETKDSTFFESCGLGDLIATCFGGRNRKCAEAFARNNGAVSWDDLERQLLNGQKLQGVLTSYDVARLLRSRLAQHGEHERSFPLFRRIHAIVCGELSVHHISDYEDDSNPPCRSAL